LGHAGYIWSMFIRKNKNRSGSVSIQICEKVNRTNRVLKTVGIAKTFRDEELLMMLAKTQMKHMEGTLELFTEHDDLVVENFVNQLSSGDFRVVGAERILGRIYQKIGYPEDGSCNYFKGLVLCRLVYPGSKLKTTQYFSRHLNLHVSVYTIYRFLDELSAQLKTRIEDITFAHTTSVINKQIGVVFYDMTSLYFEASEEDDFRVSGYSKDGKHSHPQILIGLLVTAQGYPVGYQLFEGNTAETKTLIPILETFQKRFGLHKPVVVADSALLSQKNIDALCDGGYSYILGGRLKNESDLVKQQVLQLSVAEAKPGQLPHQNGRLVVTYSSKRAKKDKANRQKGLTRLEKKVASGNLTKEHINNRGYNKYLTLEGRAQISIDYKRFEADQVWDGLKGYITNTTLPADQVINQYHQLWHIEKAFRISKTDLRIRPVYHRLKNRIESHICICFAAYTIYKELERLLQINQIDISVEKAIEEIKEIRQLSYRLPKSKTVKTKLLQPTAIQEKLLNLKF